ncbi:MAG: hypothetical protein ABSB11_03655 [Sedimentisphaerales bacterium]
MAIRLSPEGGKVKPAFRGKLCKDDHFLTGEITNCLFCTAKSKGKK